MCYSLHERFLDVNDLQYTGGMIVLDLVLVVELNTAIVLQALFIFQKQFDSVDIALVEVFGLFFCGQNDRSYNFFYCDFVELGVQCVLLRGFKRKSKRTLYYRKFYLVLVLVIDDGLRIQFWLLF